MHGPWYPSFRDSICRVDRSPASFSYGKGLGERPGALRENCGALFAGLRRAEGSGRAAEPRDIFYGTGGLVIVISGKFRYNNSM